MNHEIEAGMWGALVATGWLTLFDMKPDWWLVGVFAVVWVICLFAAKHAQRSGEAASPMNPKVAE